MALLFLRLLIQFMADFRDGDHYEIVNPKTGRKEVWTGERIKAYKIAYRADIILPPPPKKSAATKKTTKK